jgi:hypothetical protein
VSAAQLGRWQRAGLLGERRREGRGRGLGVDWYWTADTLDRARIIVTTLEHKGATLDTAAGELLLRNYPVTSTALRAGLLRVLEGAITDLRRRQDYLSEAMSREEKQQRMHRSLLKRLPFTSPAINFIAGIATWMLCESDSPYSFAGIRQALRTLSDEKLEEIMQHVQADIPQMRVWPGSVVGDPNASIDALWAYLRNKDEGMVLTDPPLLVLGVLALTITGVYGKDWFFGCLLLLFRGTIPKIAEYLEESLQDDLVSPRQNA